jgi:5-formyltetrahydrofolate cyclo-ligase
MPEVGLEPAKQALRRQARRLRAGFAATSGPAAATAVGRIGLEQTPLAGGPAAWAPYPPVIAGYWPVGSELDCRPLLGALAAAGWRCALPVVAAATEPLGFRLWRPGESLRPGALGIPEPEASAAMVVPRVLLVPVLAFDRAGRRLGQGAGYYDRTLEALRALPARRPVLALGLAYAAQELPTLPVGSHDQPLDWIVTEIEAFSPL